jgi:hypothetical protein
VQNYLSTSTTGLSAQFKTLLEQLGGANESLLSTKTTSIATQITNNQARIAQYNQILGSEQTRLLQAFYAQEAIIAKLQTAQQTIASMDIIQPSIGLSSLAQNQNGTG